MIMERTSYPSVLHVAAFGACAVVSQTLFIRELLALLKSSEMVIGLLMASWLLWTGLGGLLSGRVAGPGRRRGAAVLRTAALLSGLLLPLTLIMIRVSRSALGASRGEMPEFMPAMAVSFLSMAPFGLIFGTAYNAASVLIRARTADIRKGVQGVYVREAAGSALGALIFLALLAGHASHLTIAMGMGLVMAGTAAFPRGGRGAFSSSVVVLALLAAGLTSSGRIDMMTREQMFPGRRVVGTETSRYAELTAVATGNSVTFFSGGSRVMTFPEPERAEEGVHIPLLSHPSPGRVLLLGGTVGGVVEEVLAHPSVTSVDCVEIDDGLVSLFERVRGRSAEDDDGRQGKATRRIFMDGRRYLSTTDRHYDVIIVDAPQPLNLQWNRYFTVESFGSARRLLDEGGIFALSHVSSEEYLSEQMTEVLSTIVRTMETVFDTVSVFPGGIAHLIGGSKAVDADSLEARLARRDLGASYISEAYLPERLSADRISQFRIALREVGEAEVNRDSYPVLVFKELALETLKRDRAISALISEAAGSPRWAVPATVSMLVVLGLLLSRKRAGKAAGVVVTGFCAFVIQMLIILSFQSAAGVIYHALIIVSSAFMSGAALGTWWTSGGRGPGRGGLHLLIASFVVLVVLTTVIGSPVKGLVGDKHLTYYLLSALNGLLTGAYYGRVVQDAGRGRLETTPASYYSADLFGACAGGLLGGIVLVPLSGVQWTAIMLLFLHSAASLMAFRR